MSPAAGAGGTADKTDGEKKKKELEGKRKKQKEKEDAEQAKVNSGDNAWMLTSSALVLMMTGPGLALFYCGLVRKKNVLSVMMQCIFLMCLMTVIWATLWLCAFVRKRPRSSGQIVRSSRPMDRGSAISATRNTISS